MRIGTKIFIVGGIPIVTAAGIALAALALTHEADRARSGAVLASTVYRNLQAALTSRDDYLAAAPADRERFRTAFLTQMDSASADLSTLRDLSQTSQDPAIEQAQRTLPRYVASMDKLVEITVRNRRLVTAMSGRANLLISLADQARGRQHASNADIIAALAQSDRKLRAARDVLEAAYGLRLALAAIQRAQLDLSTAADADGRASVARTLAFDVTRLRQAMAALVGQLHSGPAETSGEDFAATGQTLQQRLGLWLPSTGPDQGAWDDATQRLIADLSAFAERLVTIDSASSRTYYDQAAQLLAYSIEAHETEQAAQKIAIETLKFASRTTDALLRRDAEASRSIVDDSRTLPDTIAALPIAPSIQAEMIDAVRSWRDGLEMATEGLTKQNAIVGNMDKAAGQMIDSARSLDTIFTQNAEAIGRSVRNILVFGAGIGLLLGTGTGFLLARSITTSLQRLQIRMTELANDRGVDIIDDEGRRDELGDMARATNVFLREITRRERVIRQAKEQADQALERLRQTQVELIQAEKLASLGQLVAGVAHEINTPLGIAVTTSSVLEDDIKRFRSTVLGGHVSRSLLDHLTARLFEGARLISNNLGRAADLVQSFKHVAVDQTSGEKRRFDVEAWLRELLTSLGPMLRKTGHKARMDCPPGIVLDTHPGALAQVVTNLVVNASLHAFRPGEAGEIAISVEPVRSRQLRIVVGDAGVGILPADRAKIFDPFFTTRRAEGSTGLGLHIVYNLVTSTLAGRIECESEPGRGTRFIIDLPYDQSPAANPKGEPRPAGGTL